MGQRPFPGQPSALSSHSEARLVQRLRRLLNLPKTPVLPRYYDGCICPSPQSYHSCTQKLFIELLYTFQVLCSAVGIQVWTKRIHISLCELYGPGSSKIVSVKSQPLSSHLQPHCRPGFDSFLHSFIHEKILKHLRKSHQHLESKDK